MNQGSFNVIHFHWVNIFSMNNFQEKQLFQLFGSNLENNLKSFILIPTKSQKIVSNDNFGNRGGGGGR